MRTPRTRIVLVSERVGGPPAGGAPHPQLRGLLARDYASFTEPAAPPHDMVSPATAAVGIVAETERLGLAPTGVPYRRPRLLHLATGSRWATPRTLSCSSG